MNCNRSLLPPFLWQSKINPDNLYARQTPNKGRQLENWSKVTLQYLTIRDPAWKVKEHMWWYNPARITEAYLSLRATEAEMLRAKTFSLLPFQQNWGSEAKYLVFLPEVDVTSLLLQTTGKTHINNKEIMMLIKVSSCSVPCGLTVGFLTLSLYFRLYPQAGCTHSLRLSAPLQPNDGNMWLTI